MANIRLGRYEAEDGDLPAVCMVCGEPSSAMKRKRFSWHPQWVYLLLLVGLLPFVIVALVLTKRMTISAPLCAEHRNHWTWRSWAVGGSFVLLLVLGIGALILVGALAEGRGQRQDDAAFGYACLGVTVLGLAWAITAVIVQNTAIRPNQITDREITLVHVSPRFVDALLENDSAADEERRERAYFRRRRRGDAKLDKDVNPRAPSPRAESDQFEERDR